MSVQPEPGGGSRILIVDDDPGLREAICLSFPSGNGGPQVETASDGAVAVDILAEHDISLVVTDLKMPRLDGLGLLAHIGEHFPDIPVIIMTAYGTSELRGLAAAGGAVRFLEKPFSLADLQQGIAETLQRQSEGGALHGVSCGVFLQLVRMEQKTCTVRLTDRATGAAGVLYFVSGELTDARLRNDRGEAAALHILAWPEVSLAIENGCPCRDQKITTGLQALLLDALRLRDEQGVPPAQLHDPGSDSNVESQPRPKGGNSGDRALDALRRRVERVVPSIGGQWAVRRDPSLAPLLTAAEEFGRVVKLGPFQGGLVDLGEPEVLIVAPRDGQNIVRMQRDCPTDKVLGAVVD